MELYKGQLKNYNYNIKKTHGSNNGKGYKKRAVCYDIFSFDIETSNIFIENNKPIPYHKGESDNYWNELDAMSLVYIWQFGVNDNVFYGRDLIDLLLLLNDLPQETELQIFVHNLAFEFHHLLNILTVKDVFARSPHKPMKCVFNEYPFMTWRCSYLMTNMSLDQWGKEVGVSKKVGQLDYNDHIRTPLSDITAQELEYCEYDILVMYYGIKKELEIYDDVFSIPLTSTGKVRKIVKERLFVDENYSYFIKKLVPTVDEYALLLKCFMGGYCHCNRLHANKIIDSDYFDCIPPVNEQIISHFDFSSSYPTVLLSEKYPYSRFKKRDFHNIVNNKEQRDKYSFIYNVKITNLRSTNPNTYISFNKCEYNGEITKDNGRVINCYGDIFLTITDCDMDIISWLYKWDSITVIDSWYARKEYLPKEFLQYILELYADKTTLKGITGLLPNGMDAPTYYGLQKARLNSLYGMCVTSLIPDECQLKDNDWLSTFPSKEEIEKKLHQLGDIKKTSDTQYFVNFSWGVWCTAYARKNLFKVALGIDDNGVIHEGTENGYNTIYFDTDSAFILGRPDFTWYNDEISNKLKMCCDARLLDFDKTRPLDKKGIARPLGEFSAEDDIITFRCNHAKCYLEQRADNNYYMTISGINKSAISCLGDNPFMNFCDGFQFDKDHKDVHKLLSTYCTEQPVIEFDDGYINKYKYGINLRSTGYKISLTDEYKDLLRAYQMTWDELNDEQIITFRKGCV